jgi:hypothetical protein
MLAFLLRYVIALMVASNIEMTHLIYWAAVRTVRINGRRLVNTLMNVVPPDGYIMEHLEVAVNSYWS